MPGRRQSATVDCCRDDCRDKLTSFLEKEEIEETGGKGGDAKHQEGQPEAAFFIQHPSNRWTDDHADAERELDQRLTTVKSERVSKMRQGTLTKKDASFSGNERKS